MREHIDVIEAIRLYGFWLNWKEVARRLSRKSKMRFTADAVQAAVRRHDLQVEQ